MIWFSNGWSATSKWARIPLKDIINLFQKEREKTQSGKSYLLPTLSLLIIYSIITLFFFLSFMFSNFLLITVEFFTTNNENKTDLCIPCKTPAPSCDPLEKSIDMQSCHPCTINSLCIKITIKEKIGVSKGKNLSWTWPNQQITTARFLMGNFFLGVGVGMVRG